VTRGPWHPAMIVAVVGTNLVALTGLVLAWSAIADAVRLEDQVHWLNLAVVALIVSGTVSVSFLRVARMAIVDRSRRLFFLDMHEPRAGPSA